MRNRTNTALRLLLGTVLITGITGLKAAHAQEPGPPPDGMGPPMGEGPPGSNPDKEVAKMAKRYDLSDDQKAQVRTILVDEKKKSDALFKEDSAAPEERFAKFREIHADQVARISAVLNETQRAKYEKDEARSMHEQPGGDGEGPPPPPGGDGGGGPPDGGGGPPPGQ
jgi:protein CpxP